VDTITDADPFINGSNVPTPQQYASYSFPLKDQNSMKYAQGLGGSRWIGYTPPVMGENVKDLPALRPGILRPTAPRGTVPLSTPPDMDGHFLQAFDNDLTLAEGKVDLLRKFL